MKEISASDLVTGYVGQTGSKTRDWLVQSRGGVLFIDERGLYISLTLSAGAPSFMTEAVDELVKCLTSEDFKDKVLVILAGYKKDMDAMMKVNSGLRSRFAEELHFEDMLPDAVAAMALGKLGPKIPVSEGAVTAIPDLAGELCDIRSFANGRDVDQSVARPSGCRGPSRLWPAGRRATREVPASVRGGPQTFPGHHGCSKAV